MHRATLAILALTTLALSGCSTGAAAQPASAEAAGITSRGTGTATAAPDTATIVLGVHTRDTSAEAALQANSERAGAVIGVLERAGVDKADITTSRLNIAPTRDTQRARITGYEVTNQITATLRDVAPAGQVIDQAAAAAGDAVRVQNIDFSIADESAARAQARSEAVRRALDQATQLAEAAAVELGPVRTITELPPDHPAPYRTERTEAQAAVPIEPGTQELRVVVEIVHDVGI